MIYISQTDWLSDIYTILDDQQFNIAYYQKEVLCESFSGFKFVLVNIVLNSLI